MPVSRYRVGVTPSLRSAAGMCAAALALVVLAGCSPEPESTPEPTAAFASEEEAFQAAEATYRAYIDAVNEIDLEDPDTFEDAFAWLAGDAESASRKTFSEFRANRYSMSGETLLARFEPLEADLDTEKVVVNLCTDVSSVDVQNSSGQSVVSPDRPDLQPLTVEFEAAKTATGLVISSSTGSNDFSCDS